MSNVSIEDFLPSWFATRLKILTNANGIEDVITNLCSQGRIYELENVLLYIAGNSSMPSRLLFIPTNDIVEECVCKKDSDKLILLFKTKIHQNIIGVVIETEPTIHVRPATSNELGYGKKQEGPEIKVI